MLPSLANTATNPKDVRSYMPPVQIGEVMRGVSLGKILASKSPILKPGDWATGFAGWRDLAILGPRQVIPTKRYPGTEVPDLLGVLSKSRSLAEPLVPELNI